jgi:hypothetical protein
MRHYHDATIDTTLGELIAAVSEAAFENAANPEEAYALTAVVLADLLNPGAKPIGVWGAAWGEIGYLN